MNASPIFTPERSRTASRVFASAAFIAIGFSQSTCLPASAAFAVQGTCKWLGSGLYTASTSGSASNSSYEPYALGIFKAEAANRALSRSRDAIAVTSVCSPRCIAGMTFLRPMFAVLSMHQRSFFDIPESYRRAAGFVSSFYILQVEPSVPHGLLTLNGAEVQLQIFRLRLVVQDI